MKKVLALALALVMAFSMSAIAFADETTTAADETTTAAAGDTSYDNSGTIIGTQVNNQEVVTIIQTEVVSVVEDHVFCGNCGSEFDSDEALLAHQENCEPALMDVTAVIEDVVNAIVEIVKANTGMSGDIASVISKLMDFVAGLIDGILASESGVNGIVADLEALVAGFDFEIPVLSDLINSLKNLIKDLYAGEIATLPTEPEETPVTGSSSVGIAVFAAVSVAAAAAFVCTKKN